MFFNPPPPPPAQRKAKSGLSASLGGPIDFSINFIVGFLAGSNKKEAETLKIPEYKIYNLQWSPVQSANYHIK